MKSLVSTTDIFPSREKRRCKKFEKDFEISEKRSVEILCNPLLRFENIEFDLRFPFLSNYYTRREKEKERKKERKEGEEEKRWPVKFRRIVIIIAAACICLGTFVFIFPRVNFLRAFSFSSVLTNNSISMDATRLSNQLIWNIAEGAAEFRPVVVIL